MVTLQPPQIRLHLRSDRSKSRWRRIDQGGVHASFVLDEVNGGDGPVVDVEVGDHSEVGNASKSRVSIPQAPEVGFVEDVDELGF